MLEIIPRQANASPKAIPLGASAVLKLSVRSSKAAGEDAVIVFNVGEGSDVLMSNGQTAPDTRLEIRRRIGAARTNVQHRITFTGRDGAAPCGDLTITVTAGATSESPDDQTLATLRITCP